MHYRTAKRGEKLYLTNDLDSSKALTTDDYGRLEIVDSPPVVIETYECIGNKAYIDRLNSSNDSFYHNHILLIFIYFYFIHRLELSRKVDCFLKLTQKTIFLFQILNNNKNNKLFLKT